jgi:hypothetical protein
MKRFSFYSRVDKSQEAISTVIASSRLSAAKKFAQTKQLPLKAFLRIFGISK